MIFASKCLRKFVNIVCLATSINNLVITSHVQNDVVV